MTSLVLPMIAAGGLLLFLSGLPPLRRRSLARRLEPYLSGLHGRPSGLVAAAANRRSSRLETKAASLLRSISTVSDAQVNERLLAAGRRSTASDFRMQQIVWGLGAALLVWFGAVISAAFGTVVDAQAVVLLTVIALAGGFLARDWKLSKEVEGRRVLLQEELPTAIDLMTLSIVAGESVAAALGRVARSLGPGIGSELGTVVADIRAGSSTSEALEGLKRRVPLPGASRLVDALQTGIDRGTPLADVLRAQAEDGREARRRLLLELGGRREILMLVPVVFLIMPVVVVFTLFPGLVALDLLVP